MKVTLKKYGANSRAIVIPKAILNLFHLTPETNFEIRSENDQFVIRIKNDANEKIDAATRKIDKKYGNLFQRLSQK